MQAARDFRSNKKKFVLLVIAIAELAYCQNTTGYGTTPYVDYKKFKSSGVIVYADHCAGQHNDAFRWNIWTDQVRTAESIDGVNWIRERTAIKPNMKLQIDASGKTFVYVGDTDNELAACDPEVYKWNGYYYLQYTGASDSGYSTVFVSRSSSLGGPWAKYSKDGTWKVNSTNPAPIIRTRPMSTNVFPDRWLKYYGYAKENCYYGSVGNYYGAGQTSVVIKDGKIKTWYNDDETWPGSTLVWLNETNNPSAYNVANSTPNTFRRWNGTVFDRTNRLNPQDGQPLTTVDTLGYFNGEPVVTQRWTHTSVVVRYSAAKSKYYLHALANQEMSPTWLVRWESADGINWSGFTTIAKVSSTSHNLGVEGDPSGIIQGDTVSVYYASSRFNDDWNMDLLRYSLNSGAVVLGPIQGVKTNRFRKHARVDYPGIYGYAPAIVAENGKRHVFYCADPGESPATTSP